MVTTAANYTACNSTQYSAAKNVTVGVSLQGAWVAFRRGITGTAGTFTVALQENTGSWTQKAISATLNISTLSTTTCYYYIPFGTPYTGTANQFRLAIVSSTANLNWWRSATAGDFAFGIVGNGDDATGITSGDTVIVDHNVSVVQDQSVTLAPTNGYSLILGEGASWGNSNPAAAYTLTLGAGSILQASSGSFAVGTGTAVTNANLFTIDTAIADNEYVFKSPTLNLSGGGEALNTISLIGTKSTCLRFIVDGDAAAGQAVINTVEDVTPWVDGDTITFCGKDKTGSADNVTYTITKTGAKQITLNANLDVKVPDGAAVLNLTEPTRTLGIKVNSANLTANLCTYTGSDYYDLQGVYLYNTTLTTPTNYTSSTRTCTIDSCFMAYSGTNTRNVNIYATNSSGGLFRDIHYVHNAASSNPMVISVRGGATITKITSKGGGTSSTAYPFCNGAANTVSDVIGWSAGSASSQRIFTFNGSAHTITDLTCIGGGTLISCNDSQFTRYKQQRSSAPATLFNGSVGNVFNDSVFGVGSTNTTDDIGFTADTYNTAVLNGSSMGSLGMNSFGTNAPGSYFEFHNYAGTVGDHRTWKTNGTFTTDSPYTNLRQETTQTTLSLSHQFKLLSRTVANKQHHLVLTAQINNAAYYAGTHTDPTVNIYADGDSVTPLASLVFNDSDTSAHTKSVAFTPTTSNNQITLDFLTLTDATGSNADVLWSDCKIVQRIYGQTYTSLALGISETLTYPIAAVTTPTANSFITEATQATVNAYTGISYDGTLHVTSAHTVQEIYDWTQDYLAVNPTVEPFYSTIDGVNYVSTVNFENTSAITGGGTIDVGANTYSGGGTYDGVIITSTNRTVHVKLTGVTSGSRYYAENTGDNSQVLNDVATGNVDDLLTYTADIPISGRIRKFGLLEASFAGTIGNTGYTMPIAQGSDPSITDSAATVDSWVGYSITWGAVSKDLSDGLGAQPYSVVIDCNNQSLAKVYEWVQRQLESNSDIDAGAGTRIGIKQTNLCTKPGAQLIGATGVWLDNVASSDALNFIIYDDNGVAHQNAAPPVALTGTSIVDGSRIQVYDVDDATELANAVVSGTSYSYTYDYGTIGGHTLRVRLTYASGTSYKKEWTTSVVAGSSGASFIAAQEDWTAVNSWAIDGSAITIYTAGYLDIYANSNNPAGSALKTEFGAWWCYNLTTEDGIAQYFGGIDIPSANVIKILSSQLDLKIFNTITTQLRYTDTDIRLYRDDGSSIFADGMTGPGSNDYSGVPDVVTVASETVNVWNEPPTVNEIVNGMDSNSKKLKILVGKK